MMCHNCPHHSMQDGDILIQTFHTVEGVNEKTYKPGEAHPCHNNPRKACAGSKIDSGVSTEKTREPSDQNHSEGCTRR